VKDDQEIVSLDNQLEDLYNRELAGLLDEQLKNRLRFWSRGEGSYWLIGRIHGYLRAGLFGSQKGMRTQSFFINMQIIGKM
jgi:hypothetical protein